MISTYTSTTRLLASIAAVALVVGACSASDSADELIETTAASAVTDESTTTTSTTSTPSTTTSTTTTTTTEPLPTVDTIAPEETTDSSNTVAPPPPTDAPANTIFDPETLEGEVEQAALADYAAFQNCIRLLPNCEPSKAVEFAAFEYADATVRLVEEFNQAGYELRNGDDWRFQIDSLDELVEDRTEAVLISCTWDGTQLVDPSTDPETVVEAGEVSRRERILVRRISDRWVVTAVEVIERSAGRGNDLCD